MKINIEKPGPLKSFDFEVIPTTKIPPTIRNQVIELFNSNYQKANPDYLMRSFDKLRFMALVFDREKPIGFALADAVTSVIPDMATPQCILLAGICCIDPAYRRKGLFSYLEARAAVESGVLEQAQRVLLCGRMAHPASLRIISRNPTAVPKPGITPSLWQQQVGRHVAGLYGVKIDPETFIVRGKGRPIGYPILNIDADETEWQPFKGVNRDRGDSLLAMAWAPDAPAGW